MKTAGEILDKRLNYQQNKNLHYYEVYSEVLQAMEEYAAQFKQEKVTDEDIEKVLEVLFALKNDDKFYFISYGQELIGNLINKKDGK